MTTPAVEQNDQQYTVSSYYVQEDETKPLVLADQGFAFTRWHVNRRPASINNPLVGRWRNPSGWYHEGRFTTPNPAATFIQKFPIGGGHTQTRIYADGYGWSNYRRDLREVDTNLIGRAETKALSALQNQKVNFGVALAEAGETAELLTSVVTRVAKSIQTFRNGKLGSKLWNEIKVQEGRPHGRVPDAWLEVQYGWRPLQQDAVSAMDALAANGKPQTGTVYGRTKATYDVSEFIQSVITGKVTLPIKGKEIHQVLVRLDYELESPLIATAAQVGMINPLEIVWERLPYSFVVDWFAPVGPWLNALTAASGWRFLAGTCTVSRRLEQTGNFLKFQGDLPNVWSAGGAASYVNRCFSISRTLYSSSPLPRFPGLKNPLSAQHLGNALALLSGAVFH